MEKGRAIIYFKGDCITISFNKKKKFIDIYNKIIYSKKYKHKDENYEKELQKILRSINYFRNNYWNRCILY